MTYQHGRPIEYVEAIGRMQKVAEAMEFQPGIAVEFCTMDPYTVTTAVLTAIGFKSDDILLTVEPLSAPTEDDRIEMLVRALESAGPTENPRSLAVKLLRRGVLPTRGF